MAARSTLGFLCLKHAKERMRDTSWSLVNLLPQLTACTHHKLSHAFSSEAEQADRFRNSIHESFLPGEIEALITLKTDERRSGVHEFLRVGNGSLNDFLPIPLVSGHSA